mmetsp:Transcript_345/g.483  ORF Transcript_345/g.483 Transcript_345/m.483 type:complete len:569 (+) Transcript_345:207-1913(+)
MSEGSNKEKSWNPDDGHYYKTNLKTKMLVDSRDTNEDSSDDDFITASRRKKRQRQTIADSDEEDEEEQVKQHVLKSTYSFNKGIRNNHKPDVHDENENGFQSDHDSAKSRSYLFTKSLSPILDYRKSKSTNYDLNEKKTQFKLSSPSTSSSDDDDDNSFMPPPSSFARSNLFKAGICDETQSPGDPTFRLLTRTRKTQHREAYDEILTQHGISISNPRQKELPPKGERPHLIKHPDEVDVVDLCESSDSEKGSCQKENENIMHCLKGVPKNEGGRMPQRSPCFNALSRSFLNSRSPPTSTGLFATKDAISDNDDDIECWDDGPVHIKSRLRTSNELASFNHSIKKASSGQQNGVVPSRTNNKLHSESKQPPQSTCKKISVAPPSSTGTNHNRRQARMAINPAHACHVRTTAYKNLAALKQVSKSVWFRPTEKTVETRNGAQRKARNDLVGGSGVGVGAIQYHSSASSYNDDNIALEEDDPQILTEDKGSRKKARYSAPKTKTNVTRKSRKRKKFGKRRGRKKSWGRARNNKKEVSSNPWGPSYQHQSSSNIQDRASDLQHVGGAKISF